MLCRFEITWTPVDKISEVFTQKWCKLSLDSVWFHFRLIEQISKSFSFKTFCEKSNNFWIEKFEKFQNFKNFIFLSKMSFFDERFWFYNSAKNLATGGIPFPCQMFQQFPFRQAAGQAAGHPMIPPTSFYPPTWPYMPQVSPVSPGRLPSGGLFNILEILSLKNFKSSKKNF